MGLLFLIGSPISCPGGRVEHAPAPAEVANASQMILLLGNIQLCCLPAAGKLRGITADIAEFKHSIGHLLGRCVAAQP